MVCPQNRLQPSVTYIIAWSPADADVLREDLAQILADMPVEVLAVKVGQRQDTENGAAQ